MVLIIKCPDNKEKFSETMIVDIAKESVISIWNDFKSHPQKTRTLYPWIGSSEWSFFYDITGDGRYLVIDSDKIIDIIRKLELLFKKNEIEYLSGILSWIRDQKISKLVGAQRIP